ncbi:2-hydroxychromene-2-carboxylate isomerase [Marinobacterium nitratireducens]|uniref:2-hydroxychromene-2-carboxylate isomerase n=1 Tax=Marinobacterium nitratireducens TaxID=518897 RepID=A0A917ZP44_9GAMM|nr:2-hydroxychromene-2-carboxylate isomerase [Marinobacterium nitratireducens]GGO88487.1 2-hydroxychromene-2-carboxylate isomerase [Marinobacterium nitratireducens]
MQPQIDYYFDAQSPFVYLGHALLLEIAAKAGAVIHYRPVKLGPVFAASGAKPLAERAQSRRDYRLLELSRWSKKRGRPLNLQPQYFPVDSTLVNRCIVALQMGGEDASTFVDRVLTACWNEEQNLADPELIRDRLVSCGFDADRVLEQANSQAVEEQYQRDTDQAVALGMLGAPAYFVDGEQFWGQDRLELLEDKLAELA